MKIPTALTDLNRVLLGGMPRDSILLFTFDQQDIAKVFANALYSYMNKAVLITTDLKPAEFTNKHFVFVDAFSLENGLKPRPEDHAVNNAGSINDISLELSEIMHKDEIDAIITFTITTLLKENPKDAVYNFLNVTKARLENTHGYLALFADATQLSPEDKSKLESLCKGTFHISRKEGDILLSSSFYPIPVEFKYESGLLEVE